MTHVHQAEVGHAADEGTAISREGKSEAPELPAPAKDVSQLVSQRMSTKVSANH
jgi:hypothetical protein